MLKKTFETQNRYKSKERAVFGDNEFAFQSNVDEENIFVVNPNDGKFMGHPKPDRTYPLLAFSLAGQTSYYKDAMVTRDYDLPNRDSYDVSLFVLCKDAEIHQSDIFRRNRERQPDQSLPEHHTAKIYNFPGC